MEKNNWMKRAFKHYRAVAVGITVFSILIFGITAYSMTHSIGKVVVLGIVAVCSNFILFLGLTLPIKYFLENYNSVMENMKKGDLDFKLKLNGFESNKMFNKVTQSIGGILEEFQDLVKDSFETVDSITETTDRVDKQSDEAMVAIEQINQMMHSIADGASKQAAQSQTGEALMDTLSNEITVAYNNCNDIMDEASKMTKVNGEGQETIMTLQARAQSAGEATREISESISLLMEKVKNITSFVDTIENISAQTNLLALNAAIEAARAGEAGRGFGVVAEEIRQLADQSHESTNKVKSLVESIEKETAAVNEVMGKMNIASKEEEEAVASVGEVFTKIAQSIGSISDNVKVTNEAISRVNQDKDQVCMVIEEIAAVTQEAAAHTQEGVSFVDSQVYILQQVKIQIAGLAQTVERLNHKLDRYNKF